MSFQRDSNPNPSEKCTVMGAAHASALLPLPLREPRSPRSLAGDYRPCDYRGWRSRYILLIYTRIPSLRSLEVKRQGIARLFRNGRSQAVRLPREFRLEGEEVRISRVKRGVLIEPLFANCRRWFAELDRFGAEPFPESPRRQPRTPRRSIFR